MEAFFRSAPYALTFNWLIEVINDSKTIPQPKNEVDWPNGRLSLESYLQEYFSKILKKLRETNYEKTQKSNDISFL